MVVRPPGCTTLEGRLYQKSDAAGGTYTFTYYPTGWLSNRVDALSHTNLYDYDGVGNLTRIRYLGQATTNTFAYDNEDRLSSMADSVGTTGFSYFYCGEFSMLSGEVSPWSVTVAKWYYYPGAILDPGYTLASPEGHIDIVYEGASASRYNGVMLQGAPEAGYTSYTYLGASGQLKSVTFPNSSVISNSFDSVGRLTETRLKNKSGTTLNLHQHGYSSAHQRTSVTNFYGNHWTYGYDTVGQLKTATGQETNGTSRLHEQFTYVYDPAGNLTLRTNAQTVQSFTVNTLNQLTNVSRSSSTITVAGTTSATATNVSVRDSSALAASNASLYNDASFAAAGRNILNGSNIFTATASDSLGRLDTNSVTQYLPSSLTLQYDANGNLTNDGPRTFVYDQENQLTSVTVTNVAAGTSTKSDFVYDGLNRMRIRREWKWQAGWIQTEEKRYLYNRNRIVQELNQYNVPTVSYVWGIDLSGTLDGAGGIGGLLARVDHVNGTTAYYHADANGNVTMMINKMQAPVATYTYDAFGKEVSRSGFVADANVYRSSSREFHSLTGLNLYLRRQYDPVLQRWLNRDPIGEGGGINLYGFVGNSPVNYIDPWGLEVVIDPNASKDFKDRVAKCINILRTSKRGKELFDQANKHPNVVVIKPTAIKDSPESGFPLDTRATATGKYVPTEISFHPFSPSLVSPSTQQNAQLAGGNQAPPDNLLGGAVALGHELGHILGAADEGTVDDQGNPGHNIRDNENPIRVQLGLPPREKYRNVKVY